MLNLSDSEIISPPVVNFLPPTEDPTAYALLLAISLLACFTVAICGNVSQIVLQVYTRRLMGSISQIFIALLLLVNFMIPLGLPSVVLEKLVKIWLFGRLSCYSHHLLATSGRVLVPWIITCLHMSLFLPSLNSPRFRQAERYFPITAFGLLLILSLFVVLPLGFSAELSSIRKDQIESDQIIMLIHTFKCSLPSSDCCLARFFHIGFEYIVPLLATTYMLVYISKSTENKEVHKLTHQLSCVVLLHFGCGALFYLSEENKIRLASFFPDYVEPHDIPNLLPYLSSALIWIPISKASATVSMVRLDSGEEPPRQPLLQVSFFIKSGSSAASRALTPTSTSDRLASS